MIKLMTDISQAEKAYEFDSVLGSRIYTLYNCYGNNYPFVRLWICCDEKDQITACMSIMSGVATIAASARCDFEELAMFFGKDDTIDVFEIDEKTGVEFNKYLNYKFTTRPIMNFGGNLNYEKPKFPIYTDVLKFSFKILKDSDEDFKNVDFISWFYDIHNRTKNNHCKIFALKYDGKWVSTGGYYITSPVSAIIGGIATEPEYRKMGFASELVKYLTNLILQQNKTPCLIAADDSLEEFYNKLGYKRTSAEMCIKIPSDKIN